MNVASLAALVPLSALPVAGALWLFRRLRRVERVAWSVGVALLAAGAVAGAGTAYAERSVFRFAELSVDASAQSRLAAFLTLLLFAAPLEEAAKVLVVWPAVVLRRAGGPLSSFVFAACAASGFAGAEAVVFVLGSELSLVSVLRALLGLPAHAFCAGLWGYAWGERFRGRRLFASAWLGAVALHALYDHIVFGRGPGLLVIAAPLLLAMGLFAWSALRDMLPAPGRDGVLRLPLPEPPSLTTVRHALQRADQPLMLRWIVFGALVNIGMVLACIAVTVLLSHRFGIDLALADEADVRSSGPLVILGTSVLASFPLSGYLIARASGARGVLEPAFAAALAIAVAVALLSLTAPTAVIFALAVAPVAFGLACAGAWFGVDA